MSAVDGDGGASYVPPGTWSVDAPRSRVAFAVKHMMLATMNGRFHEFDGVLEMGSGAPRATGVVRAASIDTNESVRDEHLRSSPTSSTSSAIRRSASTRPGSNTSTVGGCASSAT